VEEEIDLREYVNVIVKGWKCIAVLTVVAMVAAIIVSFLLPPTYEATAGVVIVKSVSDISFEPKFRSLTEQELAQAVDVDSRRKAFEGLVESSAVAAEVIAKLKFMLEPEEQEVNALLKMVEILSRGDLILIKVRGKDPKKVAAIANAWGETYEKYINELYGGRSPSLESIKVQAAQARESYQKAEEALIRFLGDNQIDTLTREIADKKKTLADYYTAKQGIDHLITNANVLRDQLQEGTSSSVTADALSISLLKASAFSLLAPDLPAQLQLALEQTTGIETSVQEQVKELDTLIAALKTRQEEVQALIDDATLQQEILELEEQLEREDAKKRELTQARDLAWETYQTLARKEVEVEVAAEVMDAEVRFAVPAVEPKYPVAPNKKVNIAIGGLLGLMIGVLVAFVRNTSARPKAA